MMTVSLIAGHSIVHSYRGSRIESVDGPCQMALPRFEWNVSDVPSFLEYLSFSQNTRVFELNLKLMFSTVEPGSGTVRRELC